jgi:CDP-glucose 4,6-dehydratase
LNDYHEAGVLKLDNTKAVCLLGWKPIWNTETAIEKTIEWYKSYYNNNQILTVSHIKEYLAANGV